MPKKLMGVLVAVAAVAIVWAMAGSTFLAEASPPAVPHSSAAAAQLPQASPTGSRMDYNQPA